MAVVNGDEHATLEQLKLLITSMGGSGGGGGDEVKAETVSYFPVELNTPYQCPAGSGQVTFLTYTPLAFSYDILYVPNKWALITRFFLNYRNQNPQPPVSNTTNPWFIVKRNSAWQECSFEIKPFCYVKVGFSDDDDGIVAMKDGGRSVTEGFQCMPLLQTQNVAKCYGGGTTRPEPTENISSLKIESITLETTGLSLLKA